MKIAIFAGHVGKDPGAVDTVEPSSGDTVYTVESVVSYAIAGIICDVLKCVGIESVLCIGSFEQRISDSSGCTAGVSIHADISTSHNTQGHHTIYCQNSKKGRELAFCIDKRLSITYDRTRQPHPEKLYILEKTAFPCVLVEVGFMSNPIEERWLWDREHQRVIAFEITTGIRDFIYTSQN